MKRKSVWRKRLVSVFGLSFGLCTAFTISACSSAKHEGETYLYLVRHGRTYSNERHLLVGRGGNYELTKEAAAEAKQVGETFRESGVEFDQAYSSTLGRAYDTAEYILDGAGQEELEINQEADLDDISWGDAEGYTQEEFMEKYDMETFPDAFGDADDPDFVSPIHAESKYDFCQRFSEGIDEILSDAEEGTDVLVVAHSSMQYWLEQKFPELQGQNIDNLGVTVIQVEDGDMDLVEYNRNITSE